MGAGQAFTTHFADGEVMSAGAMPAGGSLAARDSFPGVGFGPNLGAALGQRNVMTAGTGTRPMRAGVRRNLGARDNGGLL